ncbi:probable linoleate 9S-lipoxygenase 5 [Euphorbia lathyris]|uniref:probable linoleate 9S-lipoxygenase 5 n=1 Tax=Euphorbia lathyris TaxID=212925 RepID=UPI003314207D
MTDMTDSDCDRKKKIIGSVVLMKKNVLDFNDFHACFRDGFRELRGHGVSLQLINLHSQSENDVQGKVGKAAYLEDWIGSTFNSITPGDSVFKVTFDHDEDDIAIPGAFIIKNNHHSEFYLKTVTLEDVPGHGRIHFVCNSWVYPAKCYTKDRVFFTNKTYLPHETPMALRKYREEELESLRGDGKAELQEWDRVYDYAYYNDLADPDKGPKHIRPVLGGSSEFPYPRRGRTGRKPAESDPSYETRLPLLLSLNIYVPRDERFGHLKMADFLGYALKSIAQFIKPELEAVFDSTPNEFDCFDDVLKLYHGGLKLPGGPLLDNIRKNIPFEMFKEIFRSDGEPVCKFPMPQVIKESKTAWRTDEEFGREMLAGVNPVIIRRLEEFPPKSQLNTKLYGDQNSSITEEHIKYNLGGLTAHEAMEKNKLYILDHHDTVMPYLRSINATSTKTYASRTLLFLKDDGTLKPVAIELSLPHPDGDEFGAIKKVCTPAKEDGSVEGSIWQLAKAYVAVIDSGVHQLISHWLHTHAAIEPFIIGTNRNLSVIHPIHKLLHPHFRDTMNINAVARQILINAGGLLEFTVFPGKYAMEMTSMAYKNWNFTHQALPEDLKMRGIAVEDPDSPDGIRLLIKDYPYAVDGLQIWSAIKEWVKNYCSIYYDTDELVANDPELQSWWKELREVGHGDKKDEPWWPQMNTKEDLIQSCTIIIWVASALHAAINFGQYPYGGYLPNRPSLSRRLLPEIGSSEYEELKLNPEKAFFKTVTAQLQTVLGISLIEILSRHASDEVYLGQRDTPEWTTEGKAVEAFEEFGKKLGEIEEKIVEMNKDEKLKNRVGPVLMPYTLLAPSSDVGLTGRGIPNSVSI